MSSQLIDGGSIRSNEHAKELCAFGVDLAYWTFKPAGPVHLVAEDGGSAGVQPDEDGVCGVRVCVLEVGDVGLRPLVYCESVNGLCPEEDSEKATFATGLLKKRDPREMMSF
jgi:hypothetical protein